MEATVTVRLAPDQIWHLMYGHDMAHVTRLSETITDVREYRMRENGTPIYRMYHKQGPMRFSEVSDYYLFEPPRRAHNYVRESPLGGVYHLELDPVPEGTKMTHRWELEANAWWVKPLLPLIARILQRNFNRVVPEMARRMPEVHRELQE